MKVLVTGVAGAMGQLVALELLRGGHVVVGVDRRAWPDAPEGVLMHEADVRKRDTDEVFRQHEPQAVVHLATVAGASAERGERLRTNLLGTKAVLEACDRYQVQQAIFVGRHTYYGAAADSPLYHTESEPPLAVETFPELADLVAADLYAGHALWRYPQLCTAVLRVCYTLGPRRYGTLATFLRGERVPTVLGFDPLFQFMHEEDAARAIVLALACRLRGVFNVAGPPPVPLSTLIQETGRKGVTIPGSIQGWFLGKFGLPELPPGAQSHIKYPVVIDASEFVQRTGFGSRYDAYETMHAFRDGENPTTPESA